MGSMAYNLLFAQLWYTAGERERLCKLSPKCPECDTPQVQLLDTMKQKWKCRHCKHEFKTRL